MMGGKQLLKQQNLQNCYYIAPFSNFYVFNPPSIIIIN